MHRIGALFVIVYVAVVTAASAQIGTSIVSVTPQGVPGNAPSVQPAISADGRYIAFLSWASNLVVGDTNNLYDVFVRNRESGSTERVNLGLKGLQANGESAWDVAISDDGRYVAFASTATNMVTNDTNNGLDIFVRDRETATTTRVSVATGGTQTVGHREQVFMSADGRYVVFNSTATNLVPNDTNGQDDVFLHDRIAGTTVRVNVANDGAQANAASGATSISTDGRVVLFWSFAPNLVLGDTNGQGDLFVRDLQAGTTTRVSTGPGGIQSDTATLDGTLNATGRVIAFSSLASKFDAVGSKGIFVHDRQSGESSAISVVPGNTNKDYVPALPAITRDGRAICYLQQAQGAPASLVLVDRQTLTKTPVATSTTGVAGNEGSFDCTPNVDGSAIAFSSFATNLIGQDANGYIDVFVRTRASTISLDKSALTFGAVTTGATFLSQTGPQIIRLTQDGSPPMTWTTSSNQPWLKVTPASGSGSGTFSIGVAPAPGLPLSGTVTGTIVLTVTVPALTITRTLQVRLTLVAAGTSASPFGVVDTPFENRTGVTGAVPFTGWALDDVEVARVSLCRAAFGAEVAPIDPNCGGAAEMFVGFAVFIDGARPDVAGAFATYPLTARGGWGLMVLTNFLPNQGNGTYRFTMRAQDREGHWTVLGTRTMTCANASATLPFGTLDTPEQGGIAFGSAFPSFGWALTPLPKVIPFDGSTIRVLVDGVDVGKANYNHTRPDIQALFPGYNNTDGAVGFWLLDTTLMTNGLHTISWTVSDSAGAIEGIGSRFFTVSNGAAALTAAASAASTSVPIRAIDDAPLETAPLVGRRGWDLEAPYAEFAAGASGVTVIRSEEVNRVELRLGYGTYTGYLRTPAGLAPLPIGSHLDPATNTFTWAPGVGFVGRYDFVFVRSTNGLAVLRREVRIVLHPKGRGAVGPQVVIDVPRHGTAVREPFMVGGWAIDLDARDGTGVSTVHAWAFPTSGGAPMFLGATAYGGARPDVAAVHGDQFKDSGLGLIVQGVPAGDYDLALFAWSTETMGFVAPRMVRVRVTP